MESAELRRVAALVGAVVGGISGAATAALAGHDPALAFALFCAVVGAVSGALLAPSIARRRPWVILMLCVVTFSIGVLAYPLAAVLLALDYPAEARVSDLPSLYLLTPLGAFFALPFVPAVLVTAWATTLAVELFAWPVDQSVPIAPEAMEVGASDAPGRGANADSPAHPAVRMPFADVDEPRLAGQQGESVTADEDDRRFGRGALVGLVIVALTAIFGFVVLSNAASNWGY